MKPAWLTTAEGEIGTLEITGPKDCARILEYAACTTLHAEDDETPWCSAFINWCFEMNGKKGTRSAAARSWLNWGAPIEKPVEGCVVILKRGAPPSGHVCLFVKERNADTITCLGGNQADQVKYSHYPKSDVLGYRWPV
jgi:uncharacterized protein (TIGR02594 family)